MTPVQSFLVEMLRLLRRTFFAKLSEKQFYQERPMLERAITYPARWLNDRGAQLPASKYRAILMTVIEAIRRHGNVGKIRRFSTYFLFSVQEHMKHHGEEYYQASKAPRSIASILPGSMRRLAGQNASPDRTVEVLAGVHKSIMAARPIRKAKSSAHELDLFGHCKASAKGQHNAKKVLKPLSLSPDSPDSFSQQPSPTPSRPADS